MDLRLPEGPNGESWAEKAIFWLPPRSETYYSLVGTRWYLVSTAAVGQLNRNNIPTQEEGFVRAYSEGGTLGAARIGHRGK